MNRDRKTKSQVRLCLLVGVCLLALVLFAPSAGNEPGWAFFQIARASSWHRFLDWAPAWCSLKIILGCVALFLVLDAGGTLLLRWQRVSPAHFTFYAIAPPSIGLLVGGNYLLKALL